MTKNQPIHIGATALLLTAAILCGVFGLFQQATAVPTGPMMTAGDDFNLHSTVTIKTQKAADSIKGGIRGIDVSKYQGTINWKKVAKDDVDFVFVRASYGTVNDPRFLKNARGAHDNGLKVGAYHYATFKNSSQVKEEAAHFIARLKKVDITYPVVLDLEDARHKGMKKSTLTKLAIQFMDLVEAEGYTVMLYSGYNFLRDHVDHKKVRKSYDLWIANYIEQPQSIKHKIWQHTCYGKVSGIKGQVDINIAYEDLSTTRSSSGGRIPPPSTEESTREVPKPTNPPPDDSQDEVSRPSSSGSSSGQKTISVDKDISDNIKNTLNKRYPVNLSLDSNSAKEMHQAISMGLQYEINVLFDENLPIDGQLRRAQIGMLSMDSFSKKNKSKITYLVQARLFFLGYYKASPSSILDDDTTAAVKAYQKAKGLDATGNLNSETLYLLLL